MDKKSTLLENDSPSSFMPLETGNRQIDAFLLRREEIIKRLAVSTSSSYSLSPAIQAYQSIEKGCGINLRLQRRVLKSVRKSAYELLPKV